MTAPQLMHDVEIFDMASIAVGDEFRIFTCERGKDPETTLVLTDADIIFATCAQIVESLQLAALVPSVRIIGIGYAGIESFIDTVHRRARDLTPTKSTMFSMNGGATAFRSFISDELFPDLEDRWPSSCADTTLFGHSLGGLFAIDTLLSTPSLFQRYIAASPSLWWDSYTIFEREEGFATANNKLRASVYSPIGGLEDDEGRRREGANLPAGHQLKPPPMKLDMVADLERFSQQIRSRGYEGLDWETEVVADEYHVSVAPMALSRGLRHFYERR